MNKFWNDDTFSENPVQHVAGAKGDQAWSQRETYAPVPETQLNGGPGRPPIQHEEPVEEFEELEENHDEDEDFSEVLLDARLRLEQGRLYEMIMNHELFNGVDADSRAVKIVQKQIRSWAKEQMEIMLGMRQSTARVERFEIDFPLNQLELDALKKLAEKLTDGASKKSDNYVPEIKKVTEDVPVVERKRSSLNPIGTTPKVQARPQIKEQPKPMKKAEPIKRQPKPVAKVETNANGELIGKSLGEMTDQEKQQKYMENLRSQANRKAQAPASAKKPWPTYEEQEMIAMQQVQKATSGFNSQLSNSLKNVISNITRK